MPTYTSVLYTATAPALTWDLKFEDILRRALPFISADEVLGADVSLRDLGLDSMGMVELLADLESGYDVRFRDEALTMESFATTAVLWSVLSEML